MATITPLPLNAAPLRLASRPLGAGQVVRRIDSLDFSALGQLLPNPDPILRATGRNISTYREIARDSHVGACIRRRKAAVAALHWGVDRGQSAARITTAITDMLGALDMDAAIRHILEAAQYGYAPLEIDWAASAQGLRARELIALPPEWFAFDADGVLRFKSRSAPVLGELLPERKFLCPRQDATYANPYGLGDLALCYWPTVFMRGGKRFWLNFAEKYGSAFAIGKLPRGTAPAEQTKLLDELVAMVQNGVAVIPDDGTVDIQEAAGKAASADLYERLVLHCRGEISIVQTGTNQTVEASANKASAHAGMDVAGDLRDADAEIVSVTVNQLIRWTVELNWPGAAAPTFSLWDQVAKDEMQIGRDKQAYDAGARFHRSYWMRSYGYQDSDLAPDATAAAMVPGAAAAPGAPALAFAQAYAQAALAAGDPAADPTAPITNRLTDATAPAWGALLAQIEALVQAAPDAPALQRALTEAYGGLPTDDLVKLMAAAFALAELQGISDARDGAAAAAAAAQG